jgi:mono/diheme cytochrome c family protein
MMRIAMMALGVATAWIGGALAQSAVPPWIRPAGFPQADGAVLYRAACQGCHMPEGQGAIGAAAYPALASNPKLAAAALPITWVVRGHKAMPAVGRMMTDAQVAQVVGFIRTSFGNAYPDPVRAEDVAALR